VSRTLISAPLCKINGCNQDKDDSTDYALRQKHWKELPLFQYDESGSAPFNSYKPAGYWRCLYSGIVPLVSLICIKSNLHLRSS
jgi:hypothetical protein